MTIGLQCHDCHVEYDELLFIQAAQPSLPRLIPADSSATADSTDEVMFSVSPEPHYIAVCFTCRERRQSSVPLAPAT